MKIKSFIFIVVMSVVPMLAQAQREFQQVYVEEESVVLQQYYKGCELYRKQMYAASIMQLQQILPDITKPIQKERATFYIAHSRSILQQQYANDILKDYISQTTNKIYKTLAEVIMMDNYLLMGDLPETRNMLDVIDSKFLYSESQPTYSYIKAYVSLIDKNIDEARGLFINVSQIECSHKFDAIYYLGYIAYLNKDYDYALKNFNIVLKEGGPYEKANAYIAQIKFAQGDYAYVISNQDKLLTYTADKLLFSEVNRMIACSYYNSKDYVSTIDFMERFKNANGKMGRSEYYILGYSYYIMNNYSKAIDQFVNILDGNNKVVQNAYYLLGDSYIKTQNKTGAMTAFGMASDMNFDAEVTEDALYNYAKLTYEITESTLYTNKIDVLLKFYQKYPESKHRDEISGYLLNLYLNGGDVDSAVIIARRVKNPSVEVRKALQRTYYDKGIQYFKAKQFDSAIDMFKTSMTYGVTPRYSALSLFWIAESHAGKGEFNNDVAWMYKKYQAKSSSSVLEWQMSNYSIGYQYFNSQQWGYAITWFDKFIKTYNGEGNYISDAYARIGDSWLARSDYRRAKNNYKKSLSLSKNDQVEYQLAMTYGMAKDNASKISLLKRIVGEEKSQYFEKAIMELASTFLKMNNFIDAKKDLIYMLNKCPDSPYYSKALLQLAVVEVNNGKTDDAVELYKRVAKEFPLSEEAKGAHIALKSIYVSKGNIQQYFDFLKSIGKMSLVNEDDKEKLTFEVVQGFYTKSNFNKTVSEGLAYINLYPSGQHDVDILYYLADSYLRLGKAEKALKYFEDVSKMPQNQYTVASNLELSKIYSKDKKYIDAYNSLTSVIKYSTDVYEKRDALENQMSLSILSKDSVIIRKSYRAILSAKDISKEILSEAWFVSAEDLFEEGKYNKAIKSFENVNLSMQSETAVRAKYMVALSYFNLKKYDKVESCVMKLASKDTPHQYWIAKGFILLGDTYLKRNDKFQAKATYKSVSEGYDNDADGIKELATQKLKDLLK
ncbi:MAG: tetratricopeptide repeat protein [Bacteroidetes bacterium]|nr:tetratricopeptide repeat protein [Bacteroidota bacterium]